jgi:TrmH family RNA methyltransferase
MLTSTRNPRILHLRKLQNSARLRRQEGVFIAEGVRLVEEALNAGWQPQMLLYSPDLPERGMEIIRQYAARGVEAVPAASHVIQAASDTENPQGILALLPMPAAAVPGPLNFALILDGLRDPGNLGTILRTALAAGVDAVLLPPGTVDPFSPKVVRAAMGAHFHLPLLSLDWETIASLVKSKTLACFLADSTAGQPYDRVDFTASLALIIGGEAYGAGSKALVLNPQPVHIPMVGPVESLNASVAAAILIFEAARQRRTMPGGKLKRRD